MRLKSLVAAFLLLPLTFLVGGPGAVAAPSVASALIEDDPALTAPAAIAVDLSTGVTLYELEADTSLPPASTVKLVTALTALRVLDVNQQVTIIESDLVEEDFTSMGLEPGDIVTVEQLLYGALVPSGGDAARALARESGVRLDPTAPDPVERFVQEMNAVARSLGMNGSVFSNPVGRDDGKSWSTARDLARASVEVLSDRLLGAIVATPWASMVIGGPNEREIIIENTNQFVLYDGAIGVKTGTTEAAGQNLINAFRYGDRTILSVVLGSQDRYSDTTLMLDLIGFQYQWLVIGGMGASLGATDELQLQGLWMPFSRTVMVRSEDVSRMLYKVILYEQSGGGARGLVQFSLDGEIISALPIYETGQPAGEGA